MYELVLYRQENGRCPFTEWHSSLRDKQAQARILTRMRQVEAENLGDHAPVGEGVLELRIHVGAGYRVYFARSGSTLIILLCGGDKGTQSRDIEKAKLFWADWKQRSK